MSRPGCAAAAVPARRRYNTTDGEKPRIVLFIQAHGVCPIDAAANTRSETRIPEGMNLRVFSIPGANLEFNPGLMGVIQPGTFPEHPEFEGKSIDMSFPSILRRNLLSRPIRPDFESVWYDLKQEIEMVYEVSGLGDELRAVGTPFTDILNVAEPRYFQLHKNAGENTSDAGTRVHPPNTVSELYGVFFADSNKRDILESGLPFTTISERKTLIYDQINRTEHGAVESDHLFVEPKYMNARNMASRTGGEPIGAPNYINLIDRQNCPQTLKDAAKLKLNHMWQTRTTTLAHILDILTVFQTYDPNTGDLVEGIDVFVVDPTCRGADSDFACPRFMEAEAALVDSQDFNSQPDFSVAPAPVPVPAPVPPALAPPALAPAPPALAPPALAQAVSAFASAVAEAFASAAAPPAPAPPAAVALSPNPLPLSRDKYPLTAQAAAAQATPAASCRTSPVRSTRTRSHAPSRLRSRSPSPTPGISQIQNGYTRTRDRDRDRDRDQGRCQGAARGGVPQAGGNKEHLSISNSGGRHRRTKRKSRHNRTKHRVRRIVNITKRTATKRRR